MAPHTAGRRTRPELFIHLSPFIRPSVCVVLSFCLYEDLFALLDLGRDIYGNCSPLFYHLEEQPIDDTSEFKLNPFVSRRQRRNTQGRYFCPPVMLLEAAVCRTSVSQDRWCECDIVFVVSDILCHFSEM